MQIHWLRASHLSLAYSAPTLETRLYPCKRPWFRTGFTFFGLASPPTTTLSVGNRWYYSPSRGHTNLTISQPLQIPYIIVSIMYSTFFFILQSHFFSPVRPWARPIQHNLSAMLEILSRHRRLGLGQSGGAGLIRCSRPSRLPPVHFMLN